MLVRPAVRSLCWHWLLTTSGSLWPGVFSDHFLLGNGDESTTVLMLPTAVIPRRHQYPQSVCPIFPELRPYLEAAWDDVPAGSVYVVRRCRDAAHRLRSSSIQILTAALPRPSLFRNLRASREAELMARFRAKDVAAWLGNGVPAAIRGYAMGTGEVFRQFHRGHLCSPSVIVTDRRPNAKNADFLTGNRRF